MNLKLKKAMIAKNIISGMRPSVAGQVDIQGLGLQAGNKYKSDAPRISIKRASMSFKA